MAGIISKSNSMIADELHSASDIINSSGVLIGNKVTKTPNDKEYNYRHEKSEALVSFLLSILFMFVASFISIDGSLPGSKILDPIATVIVAFLL